MKLMQAVREQKKLIKRIYQTSFPRAERIPFWQIWHGSGSGRRRTGDTVSRNLADTETQKEQLELLAIMEQDQLLGFFMNKCFGDIAFVLYFAMDSSLRGKGYGSQAMKLLQEHYADKRLLLEIEEPEEEAPESDLKKARKRFYLRQGLQESGVKVLYCGVPMELLTCNGSVSFAEYYHLYEQALGERYARKHVEER